MKQFIHKSFSSQYKATIGADFLAKEIIAEDQLVSLQIWDTAGQERLQSVQGAFYRGADACMVVFDLTAPATFSAVGSWKDEVLAYVKADDSVFPFILVGNKADLVDQERVPRDKITQWCKGNGDIKYFETSAKTSAHVKEAFEELAKKAIANKL
eukprot:TRINITY_DN1626_c0_g2_i6.p1 TRINITY_DN1626_c0_g2~~TRINITY_DN1626_c0_g2_i6.p1  ORF type:complete len:155 (-),score=58.80 TRINITY_DN1626_c0_g2_i6:230-694(-)